MINLLRNFQTVSKVVTPFYTPTSSIRGFQLSTSLQKSVILPLFLILAILVYKVWHLIVWFAFPNKIAMLSLFMYFLALFIFFKKLSFYGRKFLLYIRPDSHFFQYFQNVIHCLLVSCFLCFNSVIKLIGIPLHIITHFFLKISIFGFLHLWYIVYLYIYPT